MYLELWDLGLAWILGPSDFFLSLGVLSSEAACAMKATVEAILIVTDILVPYEHISVVVYIEVYINIYIYMYDCVHA